ncbi:unnamed protein product [Arabidopsis lyrata]|uniref:C2 domain-containing protein n=1 Tax=Arabidopsis lyrata subsp. lyrata TaxID=81972 RepID=D7M2U7_ARALL|nr:uncharacterized protein LOC9307481 [Arabidopsis lyrata subsp. lyrata]EFH47670.1 hypothetical protein ARALYDRAFT_908978 [Arabidopsis lyrata subsp. lyrata]CAH8270653.1 unnamed protein product [Arabidopsis lyrata]|eukprot:XP_002871411.1 uncharacterized protein LOC9307481 [Arabidopsis lyrata subsp. lyrata]
MGIVENIRSLKLEVKIVEARNVEVKSSLTTLFVRFYLHAGNNSKIELNTAEIRSRSDKEVVIWNQSFGLECQGNETVVEELKQQSVVFELRRRNTTSFLKKWSRSELVGRGNISWKSMIESDGMEIERFVVMDETKDRVLEDCDKPLLLKIALKVQASKPVKSKSVEDLCECRDCRRCNCLDYEAFVVACALAGI